MVDKRDDAVTDTENSTEKLAVTNDVKKSTPRSPKRAKTTTAVKTSTATTKAKTIKKTTATTKSVATKTTATATVKTRTTKKASAPKVATAKKTVVTKKTDPAQQNITESVAVPEVATAPVITTEDATTAVAEAPTATPDAQKNTTTRKTTTKRKNATTSKTVAPQQATSTDAKTKDPTVSATSQTTTTSSEKDSTSEETTSEKTVTATKKTATAATQQTTTTRKNVAKKNVASSKGAVAKATGSTKKSVTTADTESTPPQTTQPQAEAIPASIEHPRSLDDVLNGILDDGDDALISATEHKPANKLLTGKSFEEVLISAVGYEFFKNVKAENFNEYLFSKDCELTNTCNILKRSLPKHEYIEFGKKRNVKAKIAELVDMDKVALYEVDHGLVLLPPNNVKYVHGIVNFEYHESEYADDATFTTKLQVVEHSEPSQEETTEYTLYTANNYLFNKDEIEALVNVERNVAYCLELIKPHNLLIGRVTMKGNHKVVMPEEQRFQSRTFMITEALDEAIEATIGSMVICQIVDRHADGVFIVMVKEVLGDFARLDVQIKLAITNNGIPYEWNAKVEQQLTKIPDEVAEKDKKNRIDVRSLPLVTIDGEDARDFDDAVYCAKTDNGYKLYVAIADVSFYVKNGTPLDNEAKKRGTSVYFPNYVVPMLPEKLSNGLCSLNPHVDRLCMVCEVNVSKNGELGDYKFYPAVMNSHARLTYTVVSSILEGKEPQDEEVKELVPSLQVLYEVYQALKKARHARGAVEFESEEVRFIFDENLNIVDILPLVRNDAHMLIEECMIAANVCAAKFIEDNQGSTLYRVHAKPSPLKLSAFRTALQAYGLTLGGGDNPTSADFAKFAESVKDHPNADTLYMLMLRAMSLAQYTPENEGHFGLALSSYAHFTSPIRRYPDLQLHREIKYMLGKTKQFATKDMKALGSLMYTNDVLNVLAESCNSTERRADLVTRNVDKVLKAKFVSQFIGQELPGIVTNVTAFGLFVSLEKYKVDGLIHISDVGSCYHTFFDFDGQRLVGENSRVRFAVGDKVTVRIMDVNIEDGNVQMNLVGRSKHDENEKSKNAKSGKKKKATPVQVAEHTPKAGVANADINKRVREAFAQWEQTEQQVVADDSELTAHQKQQLAKELNSSSNKKKKKQKKHKDK